MQQQLRLLVHIAIQVIDAAGGKTARATDDAMNAITLIQQQFRQVGSVLTGDACN